MSGVCYNMESFFQECVTLYVQLTGYSKGFRTVLTPFLPEDQNDTVVSQPAKPLSTAGKVVDCPWCRFSFDPTGSPTLPTLVLPAGVRVPAGLLPRALPLHALVADAVRVTLLRTLRPVPRAGILLPKDRN